jgi:hypothetical protein
VTYSEVVVAARAVQLRNAALISFMTLKKL